MLNRINIEMLESANERQLGVIKNIGLSIEKLESILNVITDSMTASGDNLYEAVYNRIKSLKTIKEKLYIQYTNLKQITELYRNTESEINCSVNQLIYFCSEDKPFSEVYNNHSYRIWSDYTVSNDDISEMVNLNKRLNGEDWLYSKVFEFIIDHRK